MNEELMKKEKASLKIIIERFDSMLFRSDRLIKNKDKTRDWRVFKKRVIGCKKEALRLYNKINI